MILLLLAGLAFVLIVWKGWGKPVMTRGQWRVGAGLLAIGCFAGAALVSLKGGWPEGLGLLALGMVLTLGARSERGPRVQRAKYWRQRQRPPETVRQGLSADEARSLLGVGAAATADDVRAAYSRLMRLAHPDLGGTSGLAAQLNAARDRLLKN